MTGGIAPNPVHYPTPPCTLTPQNPCAQLVSTNTSEVFNPATGSWTAGPTMPYNRYGHDQLLLPDGKVLITGGFGERPPPAPAAVRSRMRPAWCLRVQHVLSGGRGGGPIMNGVAGMQATRTSPTSATTTRP